MPIGGRQEKAPGLLVVSHHVLTKCDTPHSRGQYSLGLRRVAFFAFIRGEATKIVTIKKIE
ncbi:hypothetical protein DW869_11600 [Phocaeicola vulgatus]|nr:hypothetical protein DWX01_02540 [Bacteroides eggerthii]RHB86033.1 hypothetical protein DW869_11600 [Phocaeicola vulgatus]RHB96250.1 hypothetical protein DW866_00270 [Bacteroides eggerthii]